MRRYLLYGTFLLPILFLFLWIGYRDAFYLVLSGAFFILAFLLTFSQFFPKLKINFFKKIKLPKRKKHISFSSFKKDPFKQIQFKQIFSWKEIILFLVILVGIGCISLFLLPYVSAANVFIAYVFSWIKLLRMNSVMTSGLLIGLLVMFLFIRNGFSKKSISLKNILSVCVLLLVSSITGILLSFPMLFVVASAQTNIASNIISSNYKIAGITDKKSDVIGKIKKLKQVPQIIAGGKEATQLALTQAMPTDAQQTLFYAKAVVPFVIVHYTKQPSLPTTSMYFLRDTLVINEITSADFHDISPYLGYLLVKQYFGNRNIKSYPQITIMGRQEYLKYRDDEINKQIAKITDAITQVEGSLHTIYADIQSNKDQIASLQTVIAQATAQRDSDDRDCRSGGYVNCDDIYKEWNGAIQKGQQNLAALQTQLQDDQTQASQYETYDKQLQHVKDLVSSQKDETPQELGLFEPNNSIKIVLDTTNSHAISDYLATLTHEYMHYASYVDKDKTFDESFFEEGLTEYFTRKIVKKDLNITTNLGYPVIVRIIKGLVKKVPEDELADIYFTKDEKTLESVLADNFGSKFYNDTLLYFETLPYMPPKEALQAANNILTRIGAQPIKESDIYSSFSNI